MTTPRRTEREAVSEAITEADVDAVLEEFAGSRGGPSGALLEDVAMLARDQAAMVSYGSIKGQRFYGAIDLLKLP
jgi:hypothetical protein